MSTLTEIAEEIKRCSECKKNKSGLPVPGEGNPQAKLMFVGEAPGKREAETGKPFVGRSGKLLTKLLEEIGIERKDVFITSAVKYYPGKRAPNFSEIQHGLTYLSKQIETINPEIVVLLGRIAHLALIGEVKLGQIHGQIIKKEGKKYFSTFHPAAALRFVRIKKVMRKDFAKLKGIIKRKNSG